MTIVVLVDAYAVPKESVRAEQGRLEGRFTDFSVLLLQKLSAIETWNVFVEMKIIELQQ